MAIDFEKELNEEQLRVVQEGDGPCLVLAGAGSGKTRTIVYRVAWLLEHGVDPRSIMLVTFTNKAAKEMLTRVDTLTQGKSVGMYGGTFHSLGNRILRKHGSRLGYAPSFSILDADDSRQLMKHVFTERGVPQDKLFPKHTVVADLWSYVRNSMTSIEERVADRFAHLSDEMQAEILALIQQYEKRKHAAQQMDFDDLLVQWHALVTAHPDVHQRLAERLQYILVDEYQDTNPVQGTIVTRLADAHKNLLVVGDDSQSIYSFRAATVRNILDFPKQFPGAHVFRLETNYRSTPEILAVANASIANNRERHEKTLKGVKPAGARPQLLLFMNTDRQARWIAETIRSAVDDGQPARGHAVLFRAAYQAIELELAMAKEGIPYVMRGGVRFFEQAHVKDVLGYLRVLANPQDALAWKRILMLEDGVGEVKAEKVWRSVESGIRNQELGMTRAFLTSTVGLPGRTADALIGLVDMKEAILQKGIQTILEGGYKDYLTAAYENHKDRLEDCRALAQFAAGYTTLAEFLADAALSEGFRRDRVSSTGEEPDVAVLSTIHQAKGLEWPTVYMIGLVDGQFPHYSVDESPAALEEERRLFYVATTRAQSALVVTVPMMSKRSFVDGAVNIPSRFLDEVPYQLFERIDMDRRFHIPDDETTIDVDDSGDVVDDGILGRILSERRSGKKKAHA